MQNTIISEVIQHQPASEYIIEEKYIKENREEKLNEVVQDDGGISSPVSIINYL